MESFVASSRVIKGALVGRGKRNSDTEHGERRKGREKNYSKRGDPWKGKVSPPMESVKETGVTYRRSLPQSAMLRFSLRPARSFDPPRAIYICTFCQEISPFFQLPPSPPLRRSNEPNFRPSLSLEKILVRILKNDF